MTRRTDGFAAECGFWPLITLAVVLHLALMMASCCAIAIIAAPATAPQAGRTLPGLAIAAAAALLLAAYAGLLHALGRIVRTVRAEVVLRRRITLFSVPAHGPLQAAAQRAGLAGRLVLAMDARPFALTFGLLRPRVAISTGLARCLDPDELHAVLVHESVHVRFRDPLRDLVLAILASRYFFLPLLQRRADFFRDHRELTADRYAMQRCGVRAVAGALLKVADTPMWGRGTFAAAMGAQRLLHARIDQLETGRATLPHRWHAAELALTAAGIALLVALPALVWAMSSTAALWCCALAGI